MSKMIPFAASILASSLLPASFLHANDLNQITNIHQVQEITISNISSTVMTPPIVALCRNKNIEPIATVGKVSNERLEKLAEGGSTVMMQDFFTQHYCSVATSDTPILPGKSIVLKVEGKNTDFLHMASMILPTNDGFVFKTGVQLKHLKKNGSMDLKSYDAGTEFNDELCTHIPGPQCSGEGFNTERETNNFVRPHPGLHGKGTVAPDVYNWGEPVARIKAKNM